MTASASPEEILRALRNLRAPAFSSETEFHRLVAAALCDGGFLVKHEVSLAPRCRIDFVVDGVGLEIKKGRPARGRLIEQAMKYLRSDQLRALILIVERNVTVPSTLCGKPVYVLSLLKLWGVALP